MPEQERTLGRIEVSLTAIASIVNEAVLTCYGVVGTAAKDLTTGIANLLSRDSKRGIEVRVKDGQVSVDVYVIIEYGTRITTVAQNIQSVVHYTVEKALGVPVAAVNVHVQDMRVSAD